MADLAAIREGMAANLGVISGMQVSAYMLANPTPPAAHVFPAELQFDAAFGRGLDLQVMTVQVFVGAVSDIGAQKNLDAYLAGSGSRSVKQKLEADKTLGGACVDLRVTGVSGYRQFSVEGRGSVLGAEWRVEVRATGN